MRVLIATTSSAQPPARPGVLMRCLSCPPLPTARHTRVVSRARRSLTVRISLKVSTILPWMPVKSEGMRTPNSPLRKATMAASSPRENASSSPLGASILSGDAAIRVELPSPVGPFIRFLPPPDHRPADSQPTACAPPPRGPQIPLITVAESPEVYGKLFLERVSSTPPEADLPCHCPPPR